MISLDHPFKAEVEALRVIVREADPSILEGIKWNAPSFRTTEYFATTNLRAKNGVGIILHRGARVRDLPAEGLEIHDPGKLLKWLAKDRAMVEFKDLAEIEARKAEFAALIRDWIRFV